MGSSFVKAFKRLRSYRKEAKFSTWLYRIAYNTAIDYSRKVQHHTISIDEFSVELSTWKKIKLATFYQVPVGNLSSKQYYRSVKGRAFMVKYAKCD